MRILKTEFLRLAAAFSLSLAIFGVTSAEAVVINFESLSQTGTGVFDVDSPYDESGFRLTSSGAGFSTVGSDNDVFFGSTSLFNRTALASTTLAQIGGGAFSISSIDLAINNLQQASTDIVFTGNLLGGSTVTDTFTLSGFPERGTFLFSSLFTNLVSLTWNQGESFLGHQFDDLDVNSVAVVPLPAALPLYGTGLAVMGFIGWRRKRKAVAVS